ncbi:MAG: M56 family metallopeptidase [Blastocatellia bacterium]|nr:M56 family metallopeptidase [Blastocatellia bacterium]
MQFLMGNVALQSIAQTASLILLDAIVKGALILLAAWIATFFLRKSSSSIRHRIWILAFASLLILPALSTIAPGWDVPLIDASLLSQPTQSHTTHDEAPFQSRINSEKVPSQPSAETPSHRSPINKSVEMVGTSESQQLSPAKSDWKGQWPAALFLIWIAGAAFVAIRLFVRLAGVRWMVKRSRPVKSLHLDRVAGLINGEQKLNIRISEKVPVPLIWGIFRPIILLPADAENWHAERWEMVLRHESAHLWRRDHLTLILVHVASALYWMNPLVWFAARRIEVEREQSCDDIVLQTGTRASEYARELLAIASRASQSSHLRGHLAMARTAIIEGRLRAILDPERKRGDMTLMTRLLIFAFIISISLPLAAVRIRANSVPSKERATQTAALPDSTATGELEAEEDAESALQQETTQQAASPGLEAAQALEAIGGRELHALAEALRNRDWGARRYGDSPVDISDVRAVKPLINALRDDDPVVRRIAAWALGEIRSPRAIESLRQHLSDSDADVRAQAAQSLGDIEDKQPVEDLMLALKDPYPQVRLKAAHALGDIRDRRSLPALTTALEDPDENVRDKARWAIKEIVEDSTFDSSMDYVNHTSSLVRERAAHEMGDRKDPEAVPSLINLLWDDAPNVRNKAAWALGEIRSPRAIAPLTRKAFEEGEEIAIRRQAIRGLGEIGDPAAGPALLELLKSKDWRLRSQAADALGDVGIKEAIDPLTRALDDESESVRENARKALRKIR